MFKDNGLTIVLMLLFGGTLVGHWLTGWAFENEQLVRHGEASISAIQYLSHPQFLATVFENWESEFLQMSAYVVLTAMLFQRGSAESADPDTSDRDVDLMKQARRKGAPDGLRSNSILRGIYAHSLGAALFILFLASFALHWRFSAAEAAADAKTHGEPAIGVLSYLGDAQFWFESFQNWQSEFLSTAVLVVLSIFLRERNSPESKAVGAPHSQTGT
ncbi:MAG TPA: DUF6766 family protein [Sphingomicrobium sp.]|nr:DUF6766 family protein [Sphingomicrobium sp.]